MRSARRRATSSLASVGQVSTPFSVTRWIVLRSPPKVPDPGATSLARIQSQPFFARFTRAFATTFSVSAAKPTTRRGRRLPGCDSVARMSGFSASVSDGGSPPPFFLSFCSAALATRQSATAAAHTATSAGSARSHAVSISRADSMRNTETPGGSASAVGPETSTVSAPISASAAAIAWPCLPEERFAM